jgi:hypothetical protein
MYIISKYADCWAVHDDDTGFSRPLKTEEMEAVQQEFESLKDNTTLAIYADDIYSIVVKPGDAGKK